MAFHTHYEAYGIPYGEALGERFAEVLEILKRSWADERFSFEEKFHKFQNVTIVPRPLQKPYPPLRVAATSADTYRAIGAMGLPLFVAVRLGTFEELGAHIAVYHEAYKLAGHEGQGEVYLRVPIYVAKTETLARADPEQSIMQFYKTLGLQFEVSAGRPGARADEQRAERGQALQTIKRLRRRATRQGDRRNSRVGSDAPPRFDPQPGSQWRPGRAQLRRSPSHGKGYAFAAADVR